MVTSIQEFFTIANRILHGMNPQCEIYDEERVREVLSKMHLKRRSDGHYKEPIYKWFMTHPFDDYFKDDIDFPFVDVGKWVVDKRELSKLESPFLPFKPNIYTQWLDSRYLLGDNGTLYDMLHHHQEKMYTSKDGVPIYYWIDNNDRVRTTSVYDMMRKVYPNVLTVDEDPIYGDEYAEAAEEIYQANRKYTA